MSQSAAFWDSSALVPLCLQEQSSNRVRALLKQFAPVAWWGTVVEVHSAVSRMHRSGELDDAGKQAALDRLLLLSRGWREIQPSERLRDLAGVLLDRHTLRAADSLQLAAAITWCQQRTAGRTFISSDQRVCAAATEAGFTVVYPVVPGLLPGLPLGI